MTLRAGLAVAALAVLAGAWWWTLDRAYDRGRADEAAAVAAETARIQRELHRAADALSRRAVELEIERAARTELERRLADEALDDPAAGDPGLGADSLRRLDQIR